MKKQIYGKNEWKINNVIYADGTTVMAESEEKPEPLDGGKRMKTWLKTQHSKT